MFQCVVRTPEEFIGGVAEAIAKATEVAATFAEATEIATDPPPIKNCPLHDTAGWVYAPFPVSNEKNPRERREVTSLFHLVRNVQENNYLQ